MPATPDLARLAATVGDSSRIQMLALLMEGSALTAKELALGAGIEPATATAHLRRLVEDGLLEAQSQGRHKYFRLASAEVAQLVEALMRLAPRGERASDGNAHEPIRLARSCYDHLAGRLGTGLLAMMLSKRWLQDSAAGGGQLELTVKGGRALAALGVEVEAARAARRKFASRCLDWSERQDHLAGALGAALAERLVALRWIERQRRSRVVRVLRAGAVGLHDLGL